MARCRPPLGYQGPHFHRSFVPQMGGADWARVDQAALGQPVDPPGSDLDRPQCEPAACAEPGERLNPSDPLPELPAP